MEKTITPGHLLKIFDQAPSSTVLPAKVTPHEAFYSHPPLLPGELIISQYDHVTCVDTFSYLAEGILHVTTYRIIFAGTQHSLDQGETGFTDAEPEEVARRGHHYQTRSRHASIHAKLRGAWSYEKAKSKQNLRLTAYHLSQKGKSGVSGLSRGLRHSQSLIRKSPVSCVLPGDDSSVKLQTLRPIISNIEHVDHNYEVVASIPLTSICEVKKFSKRNLPKDKQMFLMDGFEIICSSIQSHRFCLGLQSTRDAESVMKVIVRNSIVGFPELFCFYHKLAILLPPTCDILDKKDAPNFYKFKMEFDRLKLFPSENWRITCEDDRHPLQYPSETVVPVSITSEELIDVANFHRAGCFPTVCWRHKDSGAVLLRSAATCFRRGLRDSRCQADEKFLIAVSSCNEAPTNKLVVFTEHVRQSGGGLLNSSQTQMTGQLTPEEGETFFYPNTKFIYGDGLPDFKAVKQSAIKLQAVLSNKSDDSKWLSALDDTDWLSQISELLQTATQTSVAMENDGSSVLISYEDGIDRTAQVASLAQLLLDPYFRTVSGFQVLIQKEWLAFGHKFYSRTVSAQQSDELSPVFLQWLDCVWQVLQQFPFSFQFNSLLLEVIAEHVYSSRFGTFIVNSKNERDEEEIDDKTTSLWTWLNVVSMSDPDKFVNLRFNSSKQPERRALHPEYRIPCLKLWSSFYLDRYRVDHVQDALKAAELELIKLEEKYEERLTKYSGLLHRLAEVDSEDVSSRVSFYTVTLSRALGKNHSRDHLVPLPNESNNLLTASGSSATDGPRLGEEEQDVLMSSTTTRRMRRSRSLDDMLNGDMRQRKVLKNQASLKRRVGSSKFYTEEMLNVLNKESTNDVRKLPISEKYSSLKDYLDSTGIDHRSDRDVKVLETQCCGYMVKQGQVRKSWKKRWFVLDLNKKYLAYFETEKAESPKGAISCKTITRVYEHQNCGKSKRPFRFCVDTPDRTYTINAPSERSMNIWMTCLNISPTAIELQRDQT